jgi:hypothetical protein
MYLRKHLLLLWVVLLHLLYHSWVIYLTVGLCQSDFTETCKTVSGWWIWLFLFVVIFGDNSTALYELMEFTVFLRKAINYVLTSCIIVNLLIFGTGLLRWVTIHNHIVIISEILNSLAYFFTGRLYQFISSIIMYDFAYFLGLSWFNVAVGPTVSLGGSFF